jgi:hypothetical protein
MLAQLVDKHGTLRAVSDLVGVNENQMGHYHRGSRKPLIPARNRMKAKLKIPFFAWDEPPVTVEQPSAGAA